MPSTALNSASSRLPVVLLAVANDYARPSHRLAFVNKELDAIQTALEPAVQAGMCEVRLLPSAEPKKLLYEFQDSERSNRIAIFHFAGHADHFRLMLEDAEGSPTAAHNAGLAGILGRLWSLRFVFLNGCSTTGQIDRLLAYSVPVVLGTNNQIDDRTAMEFAEQFYRGLAGGKTLAAAYDSAVDGLVMLYGNPSRAYFWADQPPSPNTPLTWPWAEPRTRLHNEAALQWRLLDGIGPAVSSTSSMTIQTKPLSQVECPYRGLEPFHAQHTALYYGRDQMIDKLLLKLSERKFVVVVGPSGSGKSSLVRAGLAKAVQFNKDVLLPAPIIPFIPGPKPFLSISKALLQLTNASSSGDLDTATIVWSQLLQQDQLDVAALLSAWETPVPNADYPLLVVDQFEEIFTLCSDIDQRQKFFRLLMRIVDGGWIRILATIRADFWGYLLAEPQLSAAADAGSVNIVSMTSQEVRQAVEQPAMDKGRYFSPGLVERILYDIGSSSSRLPLLQFCLARLWTEQTEQGELSLAAYEAMGGVEQAIAGHAETFFRGLTNEQQQQARHLFLQLVRVARPDEGAEDTRQRVRLDGLPISQQQLAQELAAERVRLLVTDRDPTTGSATVEVAHEALIRNWATLRDWLNTDRTYLLWRQRFRADVERWQERDRNDPHTLLQGGLLTEAENWRAERPTDEWQSADIDFLAACIAKRQADDVTRKQVEMDLRTAKLAAERATRLAQVRKLISHTLTELERKEDPYGSRALLLAREAVYTTFVTNNFVMPEVREVLQRAIDAAPPILRALPISTSESNSVAFSPNGQILAIAGDDGIVQLWDVASGKVIHGFRGHTNRVRCVAFSRDGRRLASASDDHTVRLWDTVKRKETYRFHSKIGQVRAIAFNPDGQTIACAGTKGIICLWNGNQNKPLFQFCGQNGEVKSVTFSPDGQMIVGGGTDGSIWLWNVHTGVKVRQFDGHPTGIWSVAFSPDGRLIASAGDDGSVRLWNIRNGSQIRNFHTPIGGIRSIAFSPDGCTIFSAGTDGYIRLWNVHHDTELRKFHGHIGGTKSLAISPNGRTLATSGEDQRVRLWSTKSGGGVTQLNGHLGKINSIIFSLGNRIIVSASDDSTVRLWDAQSSQEVRQFSGHIGGVCSAVFSPDRNMIGSAGIDGSVRLWDVSNGRELHQFRGHTGGVRAVTFNLDGQMMVSASDDGSVRLWDVSNGRELHQFRGHDGGLCAIALSPDGKTISSGGADGSVRLWDLSNGREICQFRGHTGEVKSVAFSPDGQMAASAGEDKSVRLWNVSNAEQLCQFSGHTKGIWSVSFSPNGRMVISAGADATAQLWFTHIKDLIGQATSLIQRDPPDFTPEERRRFLYEE
jgi:WD40 repeat protein/energy-coupling factor transporter ATP-binding protein EcfA2